MAELIELKNAHYCFSKKFAVGELQDYIELIDPNYLYFVGMPSTETTYIAEFCRRMKDTNRIKLILDKLDKCLSTLTT